MQKHKHPPTSQSLNAALGCLIIFLHTAPVLAEEATELDAVVIESQDNPEPELPLGTGISGDALKKAPGSAGDPLRTLQSLPGMVFTDDESAEPAVRGSRPGDNYNEADFVPVSYLFHSGGVISVFNSELVESFSIYPSAYGPEYVGVTGGVFDVRLRDPKSDRFHAALDVSFLQAGLLVEGPISENQSFYLAGRFSYLDLLVEDQLEEEEDGITFEQFPKYTDYQAKYVWKASEQSTLRFQANGATDDFALTIEEDSKEIDLDPIFAGNLFEATQFNEQAVVWDWQPRSGLTVKSALSHTAYGSEAQIGGAANFDVSSDSVMLKSHATVSLGPKHDVSFGGRVTQLDLDFDVAINDPGCTEFEPECNFTNADRLSTTESIDVTAGHFFIKDNWYVTDKLTLYPGLALQTEDYLDKQFVEPRLALEYSFSDDLILSAGTGIYHQSPDFDQINEVFGNPELDYIESVQGVVGLEKKFDQGWDIKTEVYYKSLDNLISGDDDLRFNNNGEGSAWGIDTLVRKNLSDKLSGWLSVSLSDAQRENPQTGASFPFEYDQPVNVSLVGRYAFNSRWSIGAKLWLHSGAPYTPIIGATPDDETEGLYNPEYGGVNSERLPDYRRLDLRIDRDFPRASGKKTTAYLEILNLLNSKNVSYYDYNNDYSERETVYQLPTIVALGFKTEF